MKCDIVIKNGLVVDPASNREEIADVAVKNGLIIGSSPDMDADFTFDAAGMHVFPGLIDYHTHLFCGGSEIGIPPDLSLIPQGVTTAVDAGSAGTANFESFVHGNIHASRMRIRSFINLSPAGLATGRYHENVDPRFWDRQGITDLFAKYPELLLGLKIRVSRNIVGSLGLKPLESAVRLARELKTRLAVHVTDAPETMDRVASHLDSGDIFVHCYHGTGHTILDKKGRVLQAIVEAQKRGVLMDAANGRNHWAFSVAEPAIKQGFMPDIISTDLTIRTLYKDPVFGLPYLMSKYLMLGMPLKDIVGRCTCIPASFTGAEKRIGNLMPGASGDVCVFKLVENKLSFSDANNAVRHGRQALVNMMTVCQGKIMYRSL